jgi:ATP cone domain
MSDVPAREAPVWVRKRDGRVMPFEADRISRALFAASESLGQPDAFLARELTDSIVHFLTEQNGDDILSTEQIADVVITNVRELGHPLLARFFEDHRQSRIRSSAVVGETAPTAPPRPARPTTNIELTLSFPAETPVEEVLRACKRNYTLQAVFARDVVAIHNDGLMTLQGLDTPGALASGVMDARAFGPDGDLTAAQVELCGQVIVLDGPEHHQARAEQPASDEARWGTHLQRGLVRTGLRAVLNLNCATPPSSVDDLARGPLFPGLVAGPSRRFLSELAEQWLDQVAGNIGMAGSVRIDWHIGERDFRSEEGGARERLLRVARRALAGARLAFVFDRPRRPVALAEGITRQHPAVLLQVGLHLPRLAEQTNSTAVPERFLQKLSSLARLALSAGVQKRTHLRRRPGSGQGRETETSDITEGFLLDRARLLVVPIGLDRLLRPVTGRGLCAGGASLDLGKQVIQQLREVLRQDGRASRLEVCLDGPVGGFPAIEEAGLTPWEPGAGVKPQWRSAGALHALAEHGTLTLFLPEEEVAAEQLVQWLQSMAEQTEVVRVILRRPTP